MRPTTGSQPISSQAAVEKAMPSATSKTTKPQMTNITVRGAGLVARSGPTGLLLNYLNSIPVGISDEAKP
jgi:hypothetical protein